MSSCLAVPSDRPNLSQALQVAALRALVSCGEQGQLHAADVCRLAAQGDDRTPGVELSDWVPCFLVLFLVAVPRDMLFRTRVVALQTLSQLGERGAAFATELEPLLDDALPVPGQEAHDMRKDVNRYLKFT